MGATVSWGVAPEAVRSPVAQDLLREYYTEVADRYYLLHEGRRSTSAEVAAGVAEYPGGDLTPPRGVLLVAWHEGVPGGCAGLRLLDARTAELKAMFVRPAWRASGAAWRLLTVVEAAAARLGAERIRLDTRRDLVEAIALYKRHGYAEIAAYHDDPYADIFLGKELGRISAPPR